MYISILTKRRAWGGRPTAQRHPHLEGLEGRLVLSTLGVGTKVAMAPAIVASLIDTHTDTISNPTAHTSAASPDLREPENR
jgi:hypothetical protein